jgi:hypothetical protein
VAAPQTTPFSAALGRLTWMFFGPILSAFAVFAIATRNKGGLAFSDLAYFLVLGAMLAGRWVEFQYGHPQTATGDPATLTGLYPGAEWRRPGGLGGRHPLPDLLAERLTRPRRQRGSCRDRSAPGPTVV